MNGGRWLIDDAVVDTGLPQFSQKLRKLREKEKQPPVFVKRHSTAGPVSCQACEMLGRRRLKEVRVLGEGGPGGMVGSGTVYGRLKPFRRSELARTWHDDQARTLDPHPSREPRAATFASAATARAAAVLAARSSSSGSADRFRYKAPNCPRHSYRSYAHSAAPAPV